MRVEQSEEHPLQQLRTAFDPSAIGKLPKGGAQLDYVGHAAVTDRLLTVDPGWTWEPLAVDQTGLPALDKEGNLWIRLTVAGVTRIGVGDGNSMKIRIGDAIRNAAMRFGVALALWTRDELESAAHEPKPPPQPARPLTFTAKQAKNQIYKKFRESGLDVDPAKAATEAAWHSDESFISAADLDSLIDQLEIDGRPFEESA